MKQAMNRSDKSCVTQTCNEGDLDHILNANVQAVIYTPPVLADWLVELTVAVQSGTFQIPRTILPSVSREEIRYWLKSHLPAEIPGRAVRDALMGDIIAMVDRLGRWSNASRFMLRIFTGTPTTDCGFHIDTVAPGAPILGLLRVYNGRGTEYVEPANVTSMRDFYRYLSRRERLERERALARRNSDLQVCECLDREIKRLDGERAFLQQPGEVRVVPVGSIVAFKHLDLRLHWSDHAKELAWIHCSPMEGVPRLVVNITVAQTAPCFIRRDTDGIVP